MSTYLPPKLKYIITTMETPRTPLLLPKVNHYHDFLCIILLLFKDKFSMFEPYVNGLIKIYSSMTNFFHSVFYLWDLSKLIHVA